jgi:hypothetical protein
VAKPSVAVLWLLVLAVATLTKLILIGRVVAVFHLKSNILLLLAAVAVGEMVLQQTFLVLVVVVLVVIVLLF